MQSALTESARRFASDFSNVSEIIGDALRKTFASLDRQIALQLREASLDCGCTALVALHIDNFVFVANLGDSKAFVLSTDQAVALSVPHTLVSSSAKPGRKKTPE